MVHKRRAQKCSKRKNKSKRRKFYATHREKKITTQKQTPIGKRRRIEDELKLEAQEKEGQRSQRDQRGKKVRNDGSHDEEREANESMNRKEIDEDSFENKGSHGKDGKKRKSEDHGKGKQQEPKHTPSNSKGSKKRKDKSHEKPKKREYNTQMSKGSECK